MDIRESLDLVFNSDLPLGEIHYRKFLEQQPAARPLFAGVDMKRQSVLLTMQLGIVEAYYRLQREPMAEYLRVLGTRHRDKGVPRESYSVFRDTLLESLADFHGDEWDERLARQWREALDLAVERMLEGYDQRYTV